MSTTPAAFLRSHPGEVTAVLLVLAVLAAFLVPASRGVLVADVFGPIVTALVSALSALVRFIGGLL